MFKIYFKLIPSAQSNSHEVFAKLKSELHRLVSQQHEDGAYWSEEPKILISETEIGFGYPYLLAIAMFKNIIDLDAVNVMSNEVLVGFGRNPTKYPLTLVETHKFEYRHACLSHDMVQAFIAKRKNQYKNVNNLPLQTDNLTHEISATFFKELFQVKTVNGLILGEEPHGIENSRRILINFLPIFKECGVTTVCLEGFLYKHHQRLLDAYFHAATDRLPIELENYVSSLPNPADPSLSYANILLQLKKHDIRPLAIDHEVSNTAHYFHPNNFYGPDDRILSLNLYTKEIIDKELKVGRYIALVGSAHTFNTYHGYSLKQLLMGSVSFVVSECINQRHMNKNHLLFNYKETRVTQRNKLAGGEQLEADILYACRS